MTMGIMSFTLPDALVEPLKVLPTVKVLAVNEADTKEVLLVPWSSVIAPIAIELENEPCCRADTGTVMVQVALLAMLAPLN